MTIRYTCEKCGSVLKIKDELSGTDGRCPKCKTSFTVPDVGAEASAPSESRDAPGGASEDAEFDPVSFLMDGDAESSQPAAASAAEAPEKSGKRRLRKRPAAEVMDDPVENSPTTESPAEPPEPPPRREPRRSKPAEASSAAGSARKMLSADAANNARDLLTKSMEESRVRAAEMPEEPEAPGIDYVQMVRELGFRVAPIAIGCVLAILGALWLGYHLTGGGVDYPDLASVRGVVTKEGQPVAGATVRFEPLVIEKDGLRQGTAAGTTDENGRYELYYREGVEGAVVGKNRVTISKMLENGRDLVPPMTDFGFGSNIVREVEEGSNTFDLEIPSNP